MNGVFVDTGGWIALMVRDDRYYRPATLYYRELSTSGTSLWSSNYVLSETYTRLRYDAGLRFAKAFHVIVEEARAARRLKIEWVTPELDQEAWQVFSEYDDHAFSFVDCTSFVIARRVRADAVFGFDRSFRTMGFALAPDT